LGSLGAGAVALALAGCPNTASTSIYTPPTGIQIDSQGLVAGLGCGSGPGQVYRYAVVVGPPEPDGGAGTPGPAITSGVFDCFSDALFANLPSPGGGATSFGLNVFAYDRASFPGALGGCENLPLTSQCPGDDASVVKRYETQATWTTTCTATQLQGVPQIAKCGELEPTGAGAGDGGDAGQAADAGGALDASDASKASDATDAATAEASDGPAVSGEGGDAPLE
jgi:hypothetical protein